jgi:prepilin-type N-terminal cleavage/methylation domain-containing protein
LRRSPMNAEAGFTLIELLIALALRTVIASLLVNAVGSARQALNVVDLRVTQASVPGPIGPATAAPRGPAQSRRRATR